MAVIVFVSQSIITLILAQDVGLAVRAFGLVASGQKGRAQQCKLVLAGGYDPRLAENREYFAELQALVAELGLQKQVSCTFYHHSI